MRKPLFVESQIEITKYLKLRFKMNFNKEDLWVLAVITDKYTGLDRPYGFNNIQYYATLEGCMTHKGSVDLAENKRKRMDTKVHLVVKDFLSDILTFEGIEVFITQQLKFNNE